MICPNCGFENNDTAKFCNECGGSLRSESKEDESSNPSKKTTESPAKPKVPGPRRDTEKKDTEPKEPGSLTSQDKNAEKAKASDSSQNSMKAEPSKPADPENEAGKETDKPGTEDASKDKDKPKTDSSASSQKDVAKEAEDPKTTQDKGKKKPFLPGSSKIEEEKDETSDASKAAQEKDENDKDHGSEDADTESKAKDSDETAPLDLPPAFENSLEEEFDFSPLNGDEAYKADPSGIDEVLADSTYESRASAWPKGDTMEMPKIEGDEAPKQKDFKAPDPNEKKKGGKRIALIALAAVVLVGAIAGGISYQLEFWGGKVIPNVVGQTKAQATQTLEAKGFTVNAMKVKSDDTEDKVLIVDPGAGKRLDEGSEVVLQVATPRAIPSVVGKNEEEARHAFEQEGFEKVDFVKVKSNDPEDVVMSVEPGPETKVKAATPITVKITEAYVVPDTLWKGQSEAKRLVEAEGYQVAYATVYSDAVNENVVMYSDPEPGTKLESGSTVTLGISKSRANELVALTSGIVGAFETDENGDTYKIASLDSTPTYVGNNTTQVVATVTMSHTFSNGTTASTSTQRTLTIAWDSSNAPSISGMH